MIMIKPAKCSLHHRIAKMRGPVIHRDLARQILPNTKMLRPPRHPLTQRNQSACNPRDGPLPRLPCRSQMQINAPRQIKHPFNGRANLHQSFNHRHNLQASGVASALCADPSSRRLDPTPARALNLHTINDVDLALIRPVLRLRHQSRSNWIAPDVVPFFSIALAMAQKMIKESRLPKTCKL